MPPLMIVRDDKLEGSFRLTLPATVLSIAVCNGQVDMKFLRVIECARSELPRYFFCRSSSGETDDSRSREGDIPEGYHDELALE